MRTVSSNEATDGLLRGPPLRPLVQRMLASGVPFGLLEDRLRELVVEVAEQEFPLDGRRQTDSRIALISGINRKEVRRIRSRRQREPGEASQGNGGGGGEDNEDGGASGGNGGPVRGPP